MYAIGHLKNIRQAKDFLVNSAAFEPDASKHEIYEQHFNSYQNLVPRIRKQPLKMAETV
jgi:hypothetical protein